MRKILILGILLINIIGCSSQNKKDVKEEDKKNVKEEDVFVLKSTDLNNILKVYDIISGSVQ